MRKLKRAVSLGGIYQESLPLPMVHYPNHYGTFFAFSNSHDGNIFLCSCSKSPIDHYVRLRSVKKTLNAYPLRMAPLDSYDFPTKLAELSMKNPKDPISLFNFKEGLCHRCNLQPPTLIYCHPMYGGDFVQNFGWYINQTFFRFGIKRTTYNFLPDVCPPEYQKLIAELKKHREPLFEHTVKMRGYALKPPSEREELLKEQKQLSRNNTRATRNLTRLIENEVRTEFGFKRVGEAWVSETLLFQIIRQIFKGEDVIFHYRPEWLERLELDVYVPHQHLAFEYQGQQHYHPISIWGGEKAFIKLKDRDKRKEKLCKRNKVKLVKIKYTEPLSESYIRSRIP